MSDPTGPTRRTVLASAAALAAGCAVSREAPPAPPPAPLPKPGLTEETIAAAERLALVEYTPEERTQILAGLEDMLEPIRALRKLEFPNELPPALVFDPLRFGVGRAPAADAFRRAPMEIPDLPADDEAIAFAPVGLLSAWIEKRRLTSTRLTQVYLQRLTRVGPRLESTAVITREIALWEAARADDEIAQGRYRGPLHGIPYGAKDLFDTAGVETAWGAEPFRGRIPKEDAEVVRRLREAGAVLVCKTALGALAYGDIWYSGRTRNPWFREEGSSGSSSGSAAGVAAGLFAFALGTETLGSILTPSSRCGAVGLRPTFGRVPRTGAMALCWSLDKVGPIARTVEDTAFVLQALNGRHDGDPASVTRPFEYDGTRGVKGMRVGFSPAWFKGASEAERRVLDAVRKVGAELVEMKLPPLPFEALLPALAGEAAAAFEELTLSNRDDELAWQDPEAWPNFFRTARFVSAVDLVQAERLRTQVTRELTAAFQEFDAVVSPATAGGLLVATNFTGQPALTLRAGFMVVNRPRALGPADQKRIDALPILERRRVPVGIVLWGRLFDEGSLLRLGRALESALGVWAERPPL